MHVCFFYLISKWLHFLKYGKHTTTNTSMKQIIIIKFTLKGGICTTAGPALCYWESSWGWLGTWVCIHSGDPGEIPWVQLVPALATTTVWEVNQQVENSLSLYNSTFHTNKFLEISDHLHNFCNFILFLIIDYIVKRVPHLCGPLIRAGRFEVWYLQTLNTLFNSSKFNSFKYIV